MFTKNTFLFTAIAVVESYRICVPTLAVGSYQVQTLQPCLVGPRADLLLQFLHALFNALLQGISAMVDGRGEVTPLSASSPDVLLLKQHHFLACTLTLTTGTPCLAEKHHTMTLHVFTQFVLNRQYHPLHFDVKRDVWKTILKK